MDYPERLIKLDLSNLKERRIREDLIQTYKIIFGLEEVSLINFNFKKPFLPSGSARNTRSNSLRITRELVPH